MTGSALPLWLAWAIVIPIVAGAGLSFLGATGLISLKSFYDRVHAPTLGATLGGFLIVVGSIALPFAAEGRLVLRDLLIVVFITLTTPVTFILLARAAVYRDRVEGNAEAPEEARPAEGARREFSTDPTVSNRADQRRRSMDVVIIARNSVADRLVQMVRSVGSHATIYDRWNGEVETLVRNGRPTLIIMEPNLRTFQLPLPKPSSKHRVALAYVDPEGRRDLWEADSPIGFLPVHFDAGDIRTLMQTAAEILEVPIVSPWSLTVPPGGQSGMMLGVVAGICVLLAGTIAYRLPGLAHWTADTSTTPYYLVAGLTLLATGCLLKLSRPVTGGLQFVVVATLAALSTE